MLAPYLRLSSGLRTPRPPRSRTNAVPGLVITQKLLDNAGIPGIILQAVRLNNSWAAGCTALSFPAYSAG